MLLLPLSGFLDLLCPRNVLLMDNRFPGIKAGLETVLVAAVPPLFHWVMTSSQKARLWILTQVRIHVERIVQTIKMLNILNPQFPTELISEMSDAFHMHCVLENLHTVTMKARRGQCWVPAPDKLLKFCLQGNSAQKE